MPLQNRVTPSGQLVIADARGAFLGNRGILHDAEKNIIAPWRHKSWVTCQLSFKGAKRALFSAHNYTELFFLDEATAFSAGHRPCAYCRRSRFNEFKQSWLRAISKDLTRSLSVTDIDKQLHLERAIRGGGKVSYTTEFDDIAQGTFIEHTGEVYLFWKGALKRWTHHGYVGGIAVPNENERVKVLTPFSIVQLYKSGFEPKVHESALLA
ncbi:MAG: hypothetical protein ACI9ES_000370 [Oceanospirillaceae bacterium]|jgi:hypothetical protein